MARRQGPIALVVLSEILVLLLLGLLAAVINKIHNASPPDAPFEQAPAAGHLSASAPGQTSGPEEEELPEPEPPTPTEEELLAARAEEILRSVSLVEKVWQMMIVYPEPIINTSPVTVAGTMTRQALENYPVDGFLYDKKNLLSRSQVTAMLTNVQAFAKIPLILTCDEEGGRVNRLMSTVAPPDRPHAELQK